MKNNNICFILSINNIENDDIIEYAYVFYNGNIISKINSKDYNILMDIKGENLDSVELSNKIRNTLITNSNITFIIGGSNGVSNEIKNMVNYKLSFSKMTFPHQLFRVVLLEQIYRSFKIMNNEEYHK